MQGEASVICDQIVKGSSGDLVASPHHQCGQAANPPHVSFLALLLQTYLAMEQHCEIFLEASVGGSLSECPSFEKP